MKLVPTLMENTPPRLSSPQKVTTHGAIHGFTACILSIIFLIYIAVHFMVGDLSGYLMGYVLLIATANLLYPYLPRVDKKAARSFAKGSIGTSVFLFGFGVLVYLFLMFVAGTGGQ